MAKKQVAKAKVRAVLEILDPPAFSRVGKTFNVSGTCNAGDGITVTVSGRDHGNSSFNETCQILSDNWGLTVSVQNTGTLNELNVIATGMTHPETVADVDVRDDGIVTLPDESSIGSEFTACGVCAQILTDPCFVPTVYLTVHFNGGDPDVVCIPQIVTNPDEGTWEAYFYDIPTPNQGADLMFISGSAPRPTTHTVQRLRVQKGKQNVGNQLDNPPHGRAFSSPSDAAAAVNGSVKNGAKLWGYITQGGHAIHRHKQARPGANDQYTHPLSTFYPAGGILRFRPYSLLLRAKHGNQMVHHSRGFHYYIP